LDIDYCCGGKRKLGEAVKETGIEWQAFMQSMSEASATETGGSAHLNWKEAALSILVDHILEKHHAFTKEQLLRLESLLGKVRAAHGEKHGEMLAQLQHLYDGLHGELDSHLLKEEQILFPAIKAIDAFVNGKGDKPVLHCGSVVNPIRQMEAEHDSAGETLVDMRKTTNSYRLPADACLTFKALYQGLQALEADLHEHIHLENNILFPKSIEMEKIISGN
jgi:regulator of cell morphogenesis and NO signaling